MLEPKDPQHGNPPNRKPVSPVLLKSYYFLFFAILGSYLPFMNLFFEKVLGFTGKQIGSISSVRQMMIALAPPMWGILSDRIRGPRLLMAIGLAVSVVTLVFFAQLALYWQMIGLMAVFAFFNGPLFPLIDSITFGYLAAWRTTTYGRCRSFGSLGFVFVGICLWWLLEHGADLRAAFYTGAAFSCFALILVPRLPAVPVRTRGLIVRRALRLFLQKDLLVLTLCGFLSYVAMMAYYSFFGNYLHSLGFDDKWVAPIWAVGAVAETPFILYAERVIRVLGIRGAYVVGLAAVAVRLFVLSLEPGAAIIVASQLLHAFTFGAIFICGIIYINRRTPQDLRASGQSIFAAALLGAGGVVGGLVSGVFVDAFGLSRMMVFHAAFAGLSLIAFIALFRARAPASVPLGASRPRGA